MKKVAVLGAGMVTKPMIDYFLDQCHYAVIIATRTKDKATGIIHGRPHGHAIHWEIQDEAVLDRLVRDVDLVVSMIPPFLHIPVAQACLRHGKSMVTTSYVSPEMAALHAEAEQAGVLLLNEIGEDPGLDHMGAKQMIDEVHQEGGKVISLMSYGAGLPAFEFNRNPFGYKFSWSPKGVLLAATSPAAYVRRGERVDVAGDRLFDSHWLVDLDGIGTFETYPNRDSTRYVAGFGLDPDVTLFRGILRFPGWCNTMREFQRIGLLDNTEARDYSGSTYARFTAELLGIAATDDLEDEVAQKLERHVKDDLIKRMKWLGLFARRRIPLARGTRVDLLVQLMLTRMSYEPGERDMVVVHDEIVAEVDGHRERRSSSLVLTGTPFGDTAMSRAVSLPAAIASRLILEGGITTKGVQMPMLPEIYRPVLDELKVQEIEFTHRTTTLDETALRS